MGGERGCCTDMGVGCVCVRSGDRVRVCGMHCDGLVPASPLIA